MKLLAVIPVCLALCCAGRPALAPAPCSKEELLLIQSDFLGKVALSCEKGKPCAALPALKAERDARVTRWISCSP